jgi:spore germination cell wall hydrolase CwlJ-like protein
MRYKRCNKWVQPLTDRGVTVVFGVFCLTAVIIAIVMLSGGKQYDAPYMQTFPTDTAPSETYRLEAKPIVLDPVEPEKANRDQQILSEADRKMLAALVYLEARGEDFDGRVAVAEVVLNRVASSEFPDTIEGVIYDTQYGTQFTPARYVAETEPTQAQYDAVDAATDGQVVLGPEYIFFSTAPVTRNDVVQIGNHYFSK